MAMIDINNLPGAPDSDLDSDMSISGLFTTAGSVERTIRLGDWADVAPNIFNADPEWGWSYQIVGVDEGAQEVVILVRNNSTLLYEQTNLSAACITNIFRRSND